MVLIRIKDYVEYAYTYDEGQVIFNVIAPPIEQGETVTLSFDGIKAVPSSFINAALLQLTDKLSMDQIRARLRIHDSTKAINELINRSFQTVEGKQTQH